MLVWLFRFILLLKSKIQHPVPRLETIITMVIKDNFVGEEMMNIVSEMGLKSPQLTESAKNIWFDKQYTQMCN